MIEVRLLGRFSVRRDAGEIPNEAFGGRLPRRLVRVLAVRADEVVTRDALIDALWPTRAPADPDGNLNVLINRARRALNDPDAIETATGGYRLCAGRCWVDISEFGRLATDGRAEVGQGHPATGFRHLLAALDLWGEPLAEDTYEEWAQPVRRALFSEHQRVLESAVDAALLVHEPMQAAALAQRAVDEQPLREHAHLLHVRALAASGDRAGALAALRTLRTTLVEELGIDPSEEAATLERQVLEGRAPGSQVERGIDRAQSRPPPFVGRAAELDDLASLMTSLRRVGVIEGRTGSGKSRLLQEFAQPVEVPVLDTRAFLPESATPWALARRVLSEALDHDIGAAARLPTATLQALSELVLPELAEQRSEPPMSLEHGTRRALALEGGIRLLTSVAAGGALLTVDDLQWADATSLELLALAVARVDELVIVLAHRPVAADSDVAVFLADLARSTQTVSVRVDRLSADEIAQLAGDTELAGVLHDETDGTPFAVHEVLRHLHTTGLLPGDAGAPDGSDRGVDDVYAQARRAAREGQRRSVLVRISDQPPSARQLVQLMAVVGREATAALLSRAGGRSQRDVVDDLDSLARAGLVRLGDRGWATAHDLITDSVLGNLTRAEQGRLHLLIADALGDRGSELGERAVHLRGAGDERAAEEFSRAARHQLDHHAHPEADRLANVGLGIVRDDAVRGDLLAVRAEARFHRGDIQDARDDLRRALAHATDGTRRSVLLTRSASLAITNDDLEQAEQLVDLALLDASDDPIARARALAVGSIIDMNRADEQRAKHRADEALALYEQVGDAAGVADILDARAMATFLDGDIGTGIDAFERVARLFADSGNLLRVVTPRSTRGHGLVFHDQPAAGLEDTETALELARTLGHPEGQAYALWHRSEAQSAIGDIDQAMESATGALAIAERVGHRGWTATAWRAIGVAHEATGDDDAAVAAYQQSLQAGATVPLFACWGHARLALAHARRGELDVATRHARHAVAAGPPLGQYEARLAEAAIAVYRGDDEASQMVSVARQRALAGGHLVTARMLSSM